MAYECGFEEDPVLQLKFLEGVADEDYDEVDSLSKQVIDLEAGTPLPRFVVHKSFFPQRETPLEFHGQEEKTKRLKKVSEKQIQKFRREVGNLHSGVLSLLTVQQQLKDDELTSLPSVLKTSCGGGEFRVLYHKLNHVVMQIDSEASFTVLGNNIIKRSGLNILENQRIMGVEALCADLVPNQFLELSTSKTKCQEIQSQFSTALVTFCGAFKYLRLREDDYEVNIPSVSEQQSTHPAISLTLMFSKKAQVNFTRLESILKDPNSHWSQFHNTISSRNELQFTLKNHSGPLLGLKGGCPLPGVRISVSFSHSLKEMEDFYRIVTGVNPLPRDEQETGTSYRIYPISRTFELQLVYHSAIQTQLLGNFRICIRITDHQKIAAALHQALSFIDGGHWQTCDPVGNQVVLFNVVD